MEQKGSFIGFTFDGIHSSQLGIIYLTLVLVSCSLRLIILMRRVVRNIQKDTKKILFPSGVRPILFFK